MVTVRESLESQLDIGPVACCRLLSFPLLYHGTWLPTVATSGRTVAHPLRHSHHPTASLRDKQRPSSHRVMSSFARVLALGSYLRLGVCRSMVRNYGLGNTLLLALASSCTVP